MGGGTGIFNSCFFCLTQGLRSTPFSDQIEYPTPSPTGASQKGQCLQIGDHSFQDLPRGPQGWLPIRPGISHSPLVNAPGARRQHSPPGIGARDCPGNPKPPSIIILAFVIRQTGPWTIGCFLGEHPFQLHPPPTHTHSSSELTSVGCGYSPHGRSGLLQHPTLPLRQCELLSFYPSRRHSYLLWKMG